MSRPTWARWVTRISLAIALVALVWTIRKVGVVAIAKYFRLIGWWWFAVIALEIVITSLDAIAIRAFLSPEQHKVGFRWALLSQLAGRSVNAVTPSGNVGEAIKVSVLTDHVSQSRAVATILLYNVVSFSVELGIVAIAAPVMALLMPMPNGVRGVLLLAGVVCLAFSFGLYLLVRRGMLESFGRLGTRIPVPGLGWFRRAVLKREAPTNRLIQDYGTWRDRLRAVDDKMHLSTGARRRDRFVGIVAVILSRGTSMTLSLVILHAIGGPITLVFVAGYTVGGFVVYMLASLVPMGLGVSEGGNFWLFRALGADPARGTALVIARRVTLVLYAGIGILLVAVSETVARARDRKPAVAEDAPPATLAIAQAPAPVPLPGSVTPTPVIDAAE